MPMPNKWGQKVVAIALGASSFTIPSIMAMQPMSTFAASKTKSKSKSKKKATTKPKKKKSTSSNPTKGKQTKKKKSKSSKKKSSSKQSVKRYDWNKRFAEDQKFYAQQAKQAQSKKSGAKKKGSSTKPKSSTPKKKAINCPTITNGYLQYSYAKSTVEAKQNGHSKYTFKAGSQGYQQAWKQIQSLMNQWKLPAGTGKSVQESVDAAMDNDNGVIRIEVVNGKVNRLIISYFPKELRHAPKASQLNTRITFDAQGTPTMVA